MKNTYLDSVFISRLYLCTILKNKKQNRNILLIKQSKDEKKSLSILNHNTYLLTCWRWRYNYSDRLQEKKWDVLKWIRGTKQKKQRREKNELKGLRFELYYNFADELSDGLLNNIIFNYSIRASIGVFALKFWILH